MYKRPRGTADILPQEQPYWRFVEEKATRLCQLHGYGRIDTPVFEGAGLFVRSIGEETDIVEKEMYTFEDRSGELMTLRPEGTAPVCRAYLEHGMSSLPQPVKLYYISPIFRYERPQKGRYRQHWQFGVEAIGEADPALDAEVIDLAWSLFQDLGLKGLSLVLNSIGCRVCRPDYLSALKDYYRPLLPRLCSDCRARFERNPLRLLDCKKESCLPFSQDAPRSIDFLDPACADHFRHLESYLRLLDIPFKVSHRLVRGLDYYTRTVFEIQPAEEGAQSTLAGGGRYDDLIEELGGRPTAGVGFATGIERIILNLKRQEIPIPFLPPPKVFICYVGEEAKATAVRLLAQLRGEEIPSLIAFGDKSLKAQLRQANNQGAPWALILGKEEVERETVMLRDMARGDQREVSLAEAIQLFKE